jgi:type IV pilus assembly protein PilM
VPRRTNIGVDIGASAVRAAEVAVDGQKRELVRFAQVGLPDGAVVEGEVRDQQAVAAALKRLWDEGDFGRRDVVLGVSSQRAMVRVLDMPVVDSKELRSALRYEIGDLLPIPVEQAVYDYAVLGPGKPSGDGGETTQVLVVVAQKDIVSEQIAVVSKAGLRVRAVDASPLALLRAVPPADGDDVLDAVISIGSQLVVVAVRQAGAPRFMRTATVSVESEPAVGRVGVGARSVPVEREKIDGRAGASKADPIVEEVRSSVEYFLSHAQGASLARVQLTGGGARKAGLAERLTVALGIPVVSAELAVALDRPALGLDEAQLDEAAWRWTTSAGLALWGTVPGVRSPSLVPPELALRAQERRTMVLAAAGVLVVAGGLGTLSHGRVSTTDSVNQQARVDQAQAATLQREIYKLQSLNLVQSEVQSRRQLAAEALSGDVNWVGLDGRIVKALPAGVTLTDVSFTASPASAAPTGTNSLGGEFNVGQVTLSAETTGGLPSVARFVRAMTSVPGLAAVWVSSSNSGTTSGNGGQAADMQFSATAEVTNAALSDRASALPGGAK